MEEDISKFVNVENLPEHIAIIMDGNRRWAKENNLDTASGHKEGAENLKRIAKFANKILNGLCIFNRKLEENKRRSWSYYEASKVLHIRFF